MTIQQIAEQAHNTAVKHGHYKDDSETAIKDKLIEEIDEFETAIYCNNYKPFPVLSKDNEKFKIAFEFSIKDTVGGELADIIVTACAGALELGIDIENYISAVLRNNDLRRY